MKRLILFVLTSFLLIFLVIYMTRERTDVVLPLSENSKTDLGNGVLRMEQDAFFKRVEQLPDDSKVKAILSENRLPIANQKVETLYRLGRYLSKEECILLQAYILGEPPKQMDVTFWHWVLNDTLVALCRQSEPIPDIVNTFCELYYDNRYDEVTRMYVIQHMATLYLPMENNSQFVDDPKERQRLLDAMLGAAGDPKNGKLCSVALNSLRAVLRAQDYYAGRQESRVTESEYVLTKEMIIELALAVIRTEAIPDVQKVTALSILSEFKVEESLLFARRAVSRERTDMMLMLVALACLGNLGSESDRLVLEDYAQNYPEYRQCASVALNKLNERLFL